jgi:hypothetical protein
MPGIGGGNYKNRPDPTSTREAVNVIINLMKKPLSPIKLAKKIEDKYWKQIVKHRAGFKCEICGDSNRQLNSHHIEGKGNMDLRTNLDNGICLCVTCHTMGQVAAHSTSYSGQQEFHQLLENVRNPLILDQLKRLRNHTGMNMMELEARFENLKQTLSNYE